MPYLKKNNILYLSIILFSVFPLLPEKIKGLPVALLTILSINKLIEWKKVKFDYKIFIILSSIFLINFFSVFYNLSIHLPFSKIETSLSLMLIPLFFSLAKNDENILNRYKKKFIDLFIISTGILGGISILYFYKLGLFSGELKVNSFRQAILDIPWLSGHPIYISTYYAISILFIIYQLKLIKKTVSYILYFIIFIILVVNLALLSSKGVLISLLIAIIYYLFTRIKNKKIGLFVTILFILSFTYIIKTTPTLERRFREWSKKTTYTRFDPNNSTSIRLEIYKCTIKTIKESILLGYGWNKSKGKLFQCYKKNNQYLYKKQYNTHNQYFSLMLNGGIIALFALIYFMIYVYIIAIRNKDYLLSAILIFYILLFFSENILERQTGIILFIFIVSYFAFLDKNNSIINL